MDKKTVQLHVLATSLTVPHHLSVMNFAETSVGPADHPLLSRSDTQEKGISLSPTRYAAGRTGDLPESPST